MAGQGDRRKRFISATAANYFGLEPADPGLHSRPELSRFLDDGNEFLLVVQRSGGQLSASNKVPSCPPHPARSQPRLGGREGWCHIWGCHPPANICAGLCCKLLGLPWFFNPGRLISAAHCPPTPPWGEE